MNGQWQPPQLPPMAETPDHAATMGQRRVGGGGGARGGSISPVPGSAEALPSPEELEVKAMSLGLPPLEQCLRRCPRCLQGVPIRSMTCPHCQFSIPISAKTMAKREIKDAAQLSPGVAGGMNGGYGGNARASAMAYGRGAYDNVPSDVLGQDGGGDDGGGSDSEERPRREKRRRQSTKKGPMTATEAELAELDEGLGEDEATSWKKTSGQRRSTGRVQTDKRKKKCPSCGEMNPMSVKVCRECDSVFPVGARLDSAVTSEELREKFSFEPEFNKDGTPMIEKILARRPIKQPDSDDEDAMSVLKKHHRGGQLGHHYECLVKFKGVSYAKVEWINELDVRSLGMVASRMLTNYLKSKEREEAENRIEDDEYFDQSYLEVEKVLDEKVFMMEREIYPEGYDANGPTDPEEEEEEEEEIDPRQERTPPPPWEDEGIEQLPGKRTREDPEWRPMTRCRHVLQALMEDDLSGVFHEPVDLDAYPSYSEKVDEPMDFGTIKSKLDNWEYRRNDPLGFTRDMRLVFSNCKVFNKFGSTIWYIADYLQAKFERLFQAWVLNFGDKDDRIPWEEPRARPWEEWCRKCMGPERKGNRMLVCDTCDAEYHCRCLGYAEVPKDKQWLCPVCTVMLHKGQTLFSHQTEVEKAKRSQYPPPTVEVMEVQKYLVKWSGLSYQFCTWEDREELNNDDKIEQFKRLNDSPPVSPPMSEEELSRTLSQTNHDVLPALMEPSAVLEYSAQIYSQIRAFHFLRHGMAPPTGLMKECGKAAATFAYQQEAKAALPEGAAPDSYRREIDALLFDMKNAVSHGKKYEPPSRSDLPALELHNAEYEVTLPKENGSLFMNIHQQICDGLTCVFISSLTQRMPPRHLEPTPVMRTHMVAVGDLITAINGLPVLGCDTLIIANVLQALPACVTLRLTKYAAQYFQELVMRQRKYTASLSVWEQRKMREDMEKRARGQASSRVRWQDRIERVDDHFTRTATSVGGEVEHRVIEELGQKRRLLMAVNESKDKPINRDWSDVGMVYSLADYVYAHENMGHVESMASRRHDPRAKPIEQLDPETGEVVKVWPSMTAASVALNVGVSALSACVNGITAQAGRWKWRFASKLTALALKMGVYRKNRVADLSAGPGAYLEGGMAALLAAGGGRGDNLKAAKSEPLPGAPEEDGQSDATAADAKSSADNGGENGAEGDAGTGVVAKREAEAVSSSTAMDVDTGGENGKGGKATEGAGGDGKAGGKEAGAGGSGNNPELSEEEALRQKRQRQQQEKLLAQQKLLREEKEREERKAQARLESLKNGGEARGDGEHSEDDEDGYASEGEGADVEAGGFDGDAGVPAYNVNGAPRGAAMHPHGEVVGPGYPGYDPAMGGGAGTGGDLGEFGDNDADGRGRGRPRKNSFEASDSDPSRGADSEAEEEEVDWEDSADEDADAARAEAMEEARIGMARAAARDLRESRATRAQMMEWPYEEGKPMNFKNDNELRDYQRRGVNWMLSCWKRKKRGCVLADEMGLGKTVQVVATLNYVFSSSEREKGPFLVVVPLTTIEHWRREVEAWTEMNLCVYHDNGGRDMRDLIREYEWYYSGRSKRVLKFHVLVTTYDDVITDAEMLAQVPWRAVVVDEAHRMRNKNSALLGCLQQVVHVGTTVHAYQHRVLMTGTPMQNIKEELWPLMNFIDPANFPDLQRFQEKYCKGEPGHEVEEARALRRRLKPYMLRRRKEDVTKDIPPKEETIIDIELTMVQKKYYRAIYERNHSVLNKVGAGTGKAPSLMNIQMELRKCCNHPFMVQGVEDHEVDNIVQTLVDETQDPNTRDAKMNQYQLRTLRLEKGLIHTSGKMVLLDKLLPKLRSEGHKVLIFSQFIGMLDMIQEFLSLRGHRHERLDGRTTGNERQKSIDRFNRNVDSFVFLLSTRAGGVGINLTAADTCIIYDSDWNPQNDVQAMARCHRIGQTKSVMVYRLITRDCFESEMFNRASKKLGLEQAVLGESAGTLKPRDMEDLLKKGAYALTQMDDNNNAMTEFQQMDIDSILERKSRVLVEEVAAKGLADDSDHDDDDDDEPAPSGPHRGDQHRVTWMTFGGGGKSGPSLEDPDFWRKIMPDVMTPASMVEKLDSFDNVKEGENGPNQNDLDQFMKDLGLMVVGLRKSRDEDEREKGVQLLVRVGCKRELLGDDQCDKAKKWELELQGTRLRQAARQDTNTVEVPVKKKPAQKNKPGRKPGSGGGALRRAIQEEEKMASSAATPTGKSGGSGKGSKGDHNTDMCARCEEAGVIMSCDGPCQRSFHPACLGMDDKPDADPWLCNRCASKTQKCMQCGDKGPEMDSNNKAKKKEGGVSKCQLSSCGRFYHKECLRKMEPDHCAYSKEGNFKCPQHFCFDCGKTSTHLGARTLTKCLRCAKARCPDCLVKARHVKKGRWMVCDDHEWTPQDLALFEEQKLKKTGGSEKGKRKPKVPPQAALQFSVKDEAKMLRGRAPVCYFCKGDTDDPESVEGAFIRPPFVQKTIDHGELPIWLHTNCLLYAPECSIEYPPGYKGLEDGEDDPSTPSSPGSSGARGSSSASSLKPTYYGVDEAKKRGGVKCTSCQLRGALIGCNVSSCNVYTHFACAVREGWKFGEHSESNGKLFLCLLHRAQGQVRFQKAEKKVKTPGKKPGKKSKNADGSSSKGKSSKKSSKGERERSGSNSTARSDGEDGGEGSTKPKPKKKKRKDKKDKDVDKEEGKGGVRRAAGGEADIDCPCGEQRETQGYIQCNGCQAWLHYECTGTSPEDAANDSEYRCQDCTSSSTPSSSSSKKSSNKRKPDFSDDHNTAEDIADNPAPNPKKQKTGITGKASKAGGGAEKGATSVKSKGAPKKVSGGGASEAAGWEGRGAKGDSAPWEELEEEWDRLEPDEIKGAVYGALELLAKEDPQGYFAEPVDTSMVPGYRDVVSRPLDFSTIKKRQQKGRYSKLGVSRLWEDISTVYQNAKLYNQDESDVFITAQIGLDLMHDKIAKAISSAASFSSSLQRSSPKVSSNGNSSAARQSQDSVAFSSKKSSHRGGGDGGRASASYSNRSSGQQGRYADDEEEEEEDDGIEDDYGGSDVEYDEEEETVVPAADGGAGRAKRAAAVAAAAALAEDDDFEEEEEDADDGGGESDEGEDEDEDEDSDASEAGPRGSQRKRR